MTLSWQVSHAGLLGEPQVRATEGAILNGSVDGDL